MLGTGTRVFTKRPNEELLNMGHKKLFAYRSFLKKARAFDRKIGFSLLFFGANKLPGRSIRKNRLKLRFINVCFG